MNVFRITLFVCLISFAARAQQDYTKSLDGIDWVKIESRTKVTVEMHGENQLRIKGGEMHKTPERAKGLKLVGDNGTDNTNVGFYVIKEGSNLIVRNLQKHNRGHAVIYLPASQNISVRTNGTNKSDIEISGFTGEIEASVELNGAIKVTDISGPITASTLNGNVEVTFTKVSQTSPISIFSTNGALDITLPGNTPADLSMGSINGEIYTNFELVFPEKNGLKAVSTQKVRQSINGGGVNFQLKTINGNMYLRKQ